MRAAIRLAAAQKAQLDITPCASRAEPGLRGVRAMTWARRLAGSVRFGNALGEMPLVLAGPQPSACAAMPPAARFNQDSRRCSSCRPER